MWIMFFRGSCFLWQAHQLRHAKPQDRVAPVSPFY
jgi:hypothetical protein